MTAVSYSIGGRKSTTEDSEVHIMMFGVRIRQCNDTLLISILKPLYNNKIALSVPHYSIAVVNWYWPLPERD